MEEEKIGGGIVLTAGAEGSDWRGERHGVNREWTRMTRMEEEEIGGGGRADGGEEWVDRGIGGKWGLVEGMGRNE